MCPLRKILLASFAFAWVSWLVHGLTGEACAVPVKPVGDPMRDLWQTMQARKLLQKDPDLAPLNVGVFVRNRVAVLWGSVPFPELSFKAELCLRTMTDLAEVRNQLEILEEKSGSATGIPRPSPLLLPEHNPPSLPKIPRMPSLAPAALLGLDTSSSPPQPAALPTAQSKVRIERPEPRTTQLGSPQVDLKIVPEPAATVPRSDADSLLEKAVKSLLQGEASYRQIPFAVRDGRVYLRSSGQDSESVQQAARRIARLPGVVGVVLVEKNGP